MNMNRREALLKIWQAIVVAGASSFLTFEDLLAFDASPEKRINLVWMHASSCSGCSCSFLNIEYVSVLDILTKFTNLIYHPDLSLATGDQVTNILDKVSSNGTKYVFVLEGSVPVAMPHACLMADKPISHWVEKVGSKAIASVGLGTCAVFGGVTTMKGMETGSIPLDAFYAKKGIKQGVVNLPNCPIKPEHLVYTLLHYAYKGKFPSADSKGRPLKFYERTVHEQCIYYADFQEKRYARKIGDRGCLLKLGCQGPLTRNDCLINGHNGNTNVCIRAGHPCIGCTSEHFPRQIMFHAAGDRRGVGKDYS
jgi:hydrogenase small subunit